jgi:hypothetical protein
MKVTATQQSNGVNFESSAGELLGDYSTSEEAIAEWMNEKEEENG